LMIEGSADFKKYGDRWSSTDCKLDYDRLPDRCDDSRPMPHSNLDYQPEGQPFTLQIEPGVSGTLAIEVYDGSYLEQNRGENDGCDDEQVIAVWEAYGNTNPLYDPYKKDA
jgi:hypothetical protein